MEPGQGKEVQISSQVLERPWVSSTGSSSSSSVFELEPFGNVHGDKKLSKREKSVIEAIQDRFHTSCPKCKSKLDVYKCSSCSKSAWYSAIANDGTGSVHGYFDGRAKVDTLATTNYKIYDSKFKRLDIVLPISATEEKELDRFCEHLGSTIGTIPKSLPKGRNLAIRLLLTRYGSGIASAPVTELRKLVLDLTRLQPEEVVIVDVPGESTTKYSRANAISLLHQNTCTEADCMIAVVDVGHSVSPSFLYHATEFVHSSHSAYIPIVWSEYNPELVQLELEYYSHQGLKLRDPHDHHRGVWSNHTFQAYAISGADGSKMMMGGTPAELEDGLVSCQRGGLNVVRMKDYGLVQRFNPKDQTKLEPEMGQHLRGLRSQNETAFNAIIGRNRYDGDVFLAVVTSRQNLESRVAAIRESWGQSSNLLPNIHVRYFVGNGTVSESELLRLGGIQDSKQLVVMQEVADDEYPPVRKNVNMLKTINRMVQSPKGPLRDAKIGYIMKVDDDSYVNFDGFLRFLAYHHNSSKAYQFWGDRGFGRKKDREGIRSAGLEKPYCLGGPGYILSKEALAEASRGFDDCVNEISRSPHKKAVWHSDVVISICITKATGIGCFDNDEEYHRNRVFANNYFGDEDFVHRDDLHRVVTMHPFKKPGQMVRQFKRFPRRMIEAAKTDDSSIILRQKDAVVLSDQVYQNIGLPLEAVDSKRNGNVWTLLLLLIFSIGVGANKKRILRKVHLN
ncbi:unnamed protein product [Cylindrotheca closterium]|uniref:Fringe-like glycosyltransferase domain-containing protein n=1 Tax=Cylindrotheca closterium TaxID=2856 RepID=A0AAD2JH77_9STRA|nr:unnamed protein product [Cylindrotheca closterium]